MIVQTVIIEDGPGWVAVELPIIEAAAVCGRSED